MLTMLLIQWLYSKEDVEDLGNMVAPQDRRQLLNYTMNEDERLASDHKDEVTIRAFQYFAQDVRTYLSIYGLAVEGSKSIEVSMTLSGRSASELRLLLFYTQNRL